MNIIIVSKRHDESRTLQLSSSFKHLILGILFALPMAMGFVGYWIAERVSGELALGNDATKAWQNDLDQQRQELENLKLQKDRDISSLTIRLAELQSRVMRIDAAGERLVDTMGLPTDEFDFANAPAVGGPSEPILETFDVAYQVPSFEDAMSQLADRIDTREQQLEVLDSLIASNRLQEETFVAGKPVVKGWVSSRYGNRSDPFTGRTSWHAGVDFAAPSGSDIIAVAAGMVVKAEGRDGYGKLIEIQHGNGYQTRYAHCKSMNVAVGDVVRKGDVIGAVGSTGRSTGPHVHFEVYKNGRSVDPAAYINRRPR